MLNAIEQRNEARLPEGVLETRRLRLRGYLKILKPKYSGCSLYKDLPCSF